MLKMKTIDAIIVAGGRGERLMPLTQYLPKSLIKIGEDGKTILDKQIYALRANPEINYIYIITGYRADDIDKKLKEYRDPKIKTIPDPHRLNNLLGVWCARAEMQKDFILTNGDNIFKASVIKKLLEAEEGITLLIGKKEKFLDDDMKVCLKDNYIVRVSKQIPSQDGFAESISTVKVEGDDARAVWHDSLMELIRETAYEEIKEIREIGYQKQFWTEIFNRVAEKGFPIKYIEIQPADWRELDRHPDPKALEKQIMDDWLSRGKINW